MVLVDFHPNPAAARCDGPQALTMDELRPYLEDIAIVREACPLSFGDGGVPVYRTHVAVFHYLLPMERGGVPWPVIRCPRQLGTGPCRVLLYKDPSRTPPEHATEMGMPPTRAHPASPTRSCASHSARSEFPAAVAGTHSRMRSGRARENPRGSLAS